MDIHSIILVLAYYKKHIKAVNNVGHALTQFQKIKYSNPSPPLSHEHQFYGVNNGFTRLIMKTKLFVYSVGMSIFIAID